MSGILANPRTAPQVLSVQQDTDRPCDVQLTLHVQPDLQWFEGHFPDVGLLPGVIQTTWVVEFARRYFHLPGDFRSMSNMKFMRFIMPDTTVTLGLRYIAEKGELSFEYRERDKVCASGRIGFDAGTQ
jgi:3-hydroxymyristoyl/3-hydroxydecanoyl-(acyl carrier protein) dehydratase